MKEKWKDIIGYEGLYQISNYGRIKSLERLDCRNQKRYTKIYTGYPQYSGHLRYTIFKNGVRYRFLVHRLVALHFIPNPNNLPWVRHLDDNPLNNHINNLAWGTPKDNSADMVKHNRQTSGSKNGMFGKSGALCPSARKVIDTKTGIIYETIKDAAEKHELNSGTLGCYLRGSRKNKTTLKIY